MKTRFALALAHRTARTVVPTLAAAAVVFGAASVSNFPASAAGPATKKAGRHPTPHYHINNFSRVGPFYNPHSKSYFELRVEGVAHNGNWRRAQRRARASKYLGVRGRLAVIRDRETLRWIDRTFTITEQTHIGLRLWCKVRKLQWTDGSIHQRGSFAPWTRPWFLNPSIRCNNQSGMAYMPVNLRNTPSGLRWQAAGIKKAFNYFLVEYPTGAEFPKGKGKRKAGGK